MEARLSGHISSERERALEDAFFARHDQALLQRLRAADDEKSRRQALAAAAGISDEALLDRLMALNLNPGTLVAMTFAPLVLVAWADGAMDTREKEAVLAAAKEAGLEQHPESRQLLDDWLRKQPPRELADAWIAYVKSVSASLTPEARVSLRSEILGRTRRVAE